MSARKREEIVPQGVASKREGLEIRRALIVPQVAAEAGREALLLKGLRHRVVLPFVRGQAMPELRARPILAVDVPGLIRRGFARQFSALLAVHGQTEEIVGNRSDTFYLDYYSGGGQAKPHPGKIHPEAAGTLFVGLIGKAGVSIEPVLGEDKVMLELMPTDGIYLDHTVEEKPRHSSWNATALSRIDFINEYA